VTSRRQTFSHDVDEKEQSRNHLEDSSSNRTSVRKRLELAEAGLWRDLLEELGRDAQAAQEERMRRGVQSVLDPPTDEEAWCRTAGQVIVDTLDGNVKGAAGSCARRVCIPQRQRRLSL
jgi:hypothetical protein